MGRSTDLKFLPLMLYHLFLSGFRPAGVYPSYHRTRGVVHTGQVTNLKVNLISTVNFDKYTCWEYSYNSSETQRHTHLVSYLSTASVKSPRGKCS